MLHSALNYLIMLLNLCRPLKESIACQKEISISNVNANLNKCADRFFTTLNSALDDTFADSPIQLPDFEETITYQLFITYTGKLHLTNGIVKSLPHLERDGPIRLTTNKRRIRVEFPVVVKDTIFSFAYHATIMDLGPTGTIIGNIDALKAKVVVAFDSTTAELYADVMVIDLGEINTEFPKKWQTTDWLLRTLSDKILNLFQGKVLKMVQDEIDQRVGTLLKPLNRDLKRLHKMPIAWDFLEKLAGEGAKTV